MIRIILATMIAMFSFACTAQESKYANINVIEFAEAIKSNNKAVILDVRTPKEFAAGHLENAININWFEDFGSAITELNKDTEYLVYCRSGGRSASASDVMIKNGFKNVSNMLGGITAWNGNTIK